MNAFGRTLGISLALSFAASAGQAATCADRDHVVSQLTERFGEELIANAVSPQNHVLEVYSAPDASTWTVLVTLPERGLACLAATGKGETELAAAVQIHPTAMVVQR